MTEHATTSRDGGEPQASPLMATYARWRDAKETYDALPDNCDAATEARHYREMRILEVRASGTEPETMQDLAVMLVMASDGGDATVDQDRLISWARESIGVEGVQSRKA